MHCLMGKELCKSEQNRMKSIKVTEFQNHGIMDMLKTVYPAKLKLRFAGGMKKKKKKC